MTNDAAWAWDLYKEVHGIRPRWMAEEEMVEWARRHDGLEAAQEARAAEIQATTERLSLQCRNWALRDQLQALGI